MYFAYAQDELVDVKAAVVCNNNNENTFKIDILIKANNANTVIRAAEQNYRFEFDSLVIKNPRIAGEGAKFSGYLSEGNDIFSFYSPHSLNGSIEYIVSYNIVLAGGVGTLLSESEWVKVGTLEFDVIDQNGVKDITWLGPDDFPPTVIVKREEEGLKLTKPNFYPTKIGENNPDVTNAFKRSWQHPCLANEGWLKLDWSGIDSADDIFISIDGGKNYSPVSNSGGQFLATNLSAGDYDIKIKLSEADCPVTLDDVNLFNFGFEATMESGYSCEQNAGFITLNWQPSPFTSTIKISIDDGENYTSINDELGNYTFSDLLSGNYGVKILNNNGTCLSDVGIAKLVTDVEAPLVNRSWEHTNCGESNGTITLSWANNPNVEMIQLSTDGGNSYETIPDVQQFYFMDNLTAGDHDIWIKWGTAEDACAIQLDDVNLLNAAPENTGLKVEYSCNNPQMVLMNEASLDATAHQFRCRMQIGDEWSDWINTDPTFDNSINITEFTNDVEQIQYRYRVKCNEVWSMFSAPKTSILPKCKLSNASGVFEVAVVPNPFSNRFQLNISNNQFKVQKAKIELTNLLGKIIYTKAIDLTEGENSFNIEPVSSISAGVYFANIELDNGTKHSVKLLKK